VAAEVESFVSVREPAWHGLGVVIDGHVSTSEMLRVGKLDNWNVRVEEVPLPDNYFAARPQYRTVRNSPYVPGNVDVLGYVGERYNEFQNEELFAFGDGLLRGGKWETAGSLRDGTRVFGALALDREVTIAGADAINSYLLVSTSHDGSAAIQASVTPIRVVCMNTLNAALSGAAQTFKIRHTQTLHDRLAAADKALGLADKYLDVWAESMEGLTEQEITDIQFEELIQTLYAPNDTKAGVTRFDKRADILWGIWEGDTIGEFKNTAYGAYNALNEELNWFRNGRGENAAENVMASRSGFNPVWNAENNKILAAVQAAVKAPVTV
jgi:phage/plasmid-like protein (TIGR03299 family)